MLNHEDEYLLRRLVQVLRGKELPWQDWMDGFLLDLERHPDNVSVAIDLCKVSRNTVYKYRRRNSEFARRWAKIVEGVAAEPVTRRPARREPTVSQLRRTGHCQSGAPARRRLRPHLKKTYRRHGGRNEPT
jgi:hypothetical protein